MQVSMLRNVLVQLRREDLVTLLRDRRVLLETVCSCVTICAVFAICLIVIMTVFSVLLKIVTEGLYDAWYSFRDFMHICVFWVVVVVLMSYSLWFMMVLYSRRHGYRRGTFRNDRVYAIRYEQYPEIDYWDN